MEEWSAPGHDPLILERAQGARLWDTRGRSYLDGNSSIWTNLHGHNHPRLNAAVREQLDRVAHVSYLGSGNVPATILARRLTRLLPGQPLPRVFFSDDGSTAVEVALKMAAQYWPQNGHPERTVFVAFDQAYHGDTMGASSVGGVSLFHDRFSRYHFPVERVGSVEDLARLPALQEGRVAAVVLEPLIQGVNRMRLWPAGMLRELRALCDRQDCFLILDEIMTGFGRTGQMFACQHEDVVPDFLCLAKGLSGGYSPLAATLTSARVFSGFLGPAAAGRTFFYGHSYTGHALGCAVALASLDLLRDEHPPELVRAKGEFLGTLLAELARDTPGVGEVRRLGLISGIDLVDPQGNPYPATARHGLRVCAAAREFGLLTRNIGDTVVLMPPYCVTEEELRAMVGALRQAVQHCS